MMMRRAMIRTGVLAAAVVLLPLASGWAADVPAPQPAERRLENSPRHHEWATLSSAGGRELKAFVVYPEVDKPVPAVVVIHENRGLNDWARSLADQVAEAGYVAIAPDLLSGKGPDGGGTASFESSDAARNAIYQLDRAQVRADVDAAVEHARGLEATTERVAVAGFCWGGSTTFDYAGHNPRIDAAFVFYGGAPGRKIMRRIEVPVYGFYGGDDYRITGKVPEVAKRMKELSKPYEPVVYDGAGHGFMRAGEASDASDANRKARQQAWQRWLKLLGEL